jgi:hypothetical protein
MTRPNQIFRFTAGEAAPQVFYGKGRPFDALHYARQLSRDTGVEYKAQLLPTDDWSWAERTVYVMPLEHILRERARDEAQAAFIRVFGEEAFHKAWAEGRI